MKAIIAPVAAVLSLLCTACTTVPPADQPAPAPNTAVTLLFTNDVESAYDPIPAFWIDGMDHIGGMAELSTLIADIRSEEPSVFLFDAGDIFTGSLAKETRGRLSFDLMAAMDYDAMAIGNHEFEFGHDILAWEKNRAPFPVLGANLFYKGTDHPFAQTHTIIERDGVRIGVIGIMGQDAATAIIPSHISALDVRDPAEAVQRSVDALRDDVDLIVLLTHQGKTAPMQTDAESDPRLQRDIDADIALAGAVEGIDVLFAGHADAGTPEPVRHPETGTLIMQTYGQATHLGYLQLALDPETDKIVDFDGKLIPVASDLLEPDPLVASKIKQYRTAHPELLEAIGETSHQMVRRYIEESALGDLFADIFRQASGADIGLVHSGSLRKDLPGGTIHRVDILDTYPFVDSVIEMRLSGAQLREVMEQSFSLERGILQVSGLSVVYDLDQPVGARVVSISRDGRAILPSDQLTVAVAGFLAEGGDLYTTFTQAETLETYGKVSDELIAYFQAAGLITPPPGGRQTPVKPSND